MPSEFGGIEVKPGAGSEFGGVSADTPEVHTHFGAAGDALAGVGSSFANHALNVYEMLRKVPGAASILPDSAKLRQAIQDSTPDNTWSHAGQIGENMLEFALPAGKVGELTEGAGLAARAASQAATAGAVRAAQGGDSSSVANTAVLGALGPVVGDAAGAVGSRAINAIRSNPEAAKVAADVVGVISPRMGNAIRVGSRVMSLADKLKAAATTAETESSDPILNSLATLRSKGGKFSDLSAKEQAEVKDLAERFRGAGDQQEKPPSEILPAQKMLAAPAADTVVPPNSSQAAPAAPEVSQLDAIAQAGLFGKKYKNFASAPAEAQATIRGVVEGMKPSANGIANAPTVSPTPIANAPTVSPTPIANVGDPSTAIEKPAVIDVRNPINGVSRETQSPAEMFRALPDEAARAAFLRQRETGKTDSRTIADGMYAQGNQTAAESGKVYEAAARADKADKIAQALYDHGVSHSDLSPHQSSELVKLLAPVAKGLGIKAPSTTTIPEVLWRLQRLEAAKAKLAAGGQ